MDEVIQNVGMTYEDMNVEYICHGYSRHKVTIRPPILEGQASQDTATSNSNLKI